MMYPKPSFYGERATVQTRKDMLTEPDLVHGIPAMGFH